MSLGAPAVLALWNGHTDEDESYDLWHTREHVAERLAVPGIRFVRRYAGGEGPLPPWFTLYGLDGLRVLESPPYRRLLENPTDWSRAMRPGMRDFLRRGCTLAGSFGAGVGGCLAAALVALTADADRVLQTLSPIAAWPAFTALHLAMVDARVSAVPFGGAEPAAAAGANAILLVEGYEAGALRGGIECLAGALKAGAVCRSEPDFSFYRLAFALGADERGGMLALPPGHR